MGDTALLPGRAAVLLVPSIAYEEAREVLARFDDPEPEYLTDLSSEVAENRNRRKTFARVVATIVLAPIALWILFLLAELVRGAFR
jgi:hypothetical protein